MASSSLSTIDRVIARVKDTNLDDGCPSQEPDGLTTVLRQTKIICKYLHASGGSGDSHQVFWR